MAGKFFILSLMLVALHVSLSSQSPSGRNVRQIFDDGTGTTPETLNTTPVNSPCVLRCIVTPEYNPVCASNRLTYVNNGQFECARRCGLNIRIVRLGRCMPEP